MDRATAAQRTPLHGCHVELGARMVEFAGWEMPVQYSGVIAEHRAVRSAAGLFDVSHMGEIEVRGADAKDFLERLTPNRVAALTPGRAQYSALLSPDGTYLDDLLLYCLENETYLVVANAANTESDLRWMLEHRAGTVDIEDVSAHTALIALQGPRSQQILSRVCEARLSDLARYRCVRVEVCGVGATVSRTGYTGEDGFEIYVGADASPPVWRTLLEAGSDLGLLPAGLGARDTLRLEAGLVLYGHEIDQSVTPFEAGLDWVVKLDQDDFIGREALVQQRERGVERRLAGLELRGRRIARSRDVVRAGGEVIGRVTSGTWSPTLERPIGMALLDAAWTEPGSCVETEVRGRWESAIVCDLPFYQRPR